MKRALVGERQGGRREVRHALLWTQRAGRRVELEPAMLAPADAAPMAARIEQVRTDDVVIGQPSIGAITRPLATGEQLRLSFLGPTGRVSGRTRSLGRIKIPSGGTGMLYGYRLALPESLYDADRRECERATIGFDPSPEVRLHRLDDEEPVRGIVRDVSLGGMQICIDPDGTAAKPRLCQGDRVRLTVRLPVPVGGMDEMVTVARVAVSQYPRQHIIGVAFEREVGGLRELIDEAKSRGARQQRAG